MDICALKGIDGTPNKAIMSHDGVELSWDIALFDRVSYNGNYDIFADINGYWNYVQPHIKASIFDVYSRIRVAYNDIWDTDTLTATLYLLTKELYELHKLEDIHHWVWFHSNSLVPASVFESFTEAHETTYSRDRTYLKEDYRWLVTLSIALRVAIPIWGEYISRTKKNNTVFKEYFAFQLLKHSNVFNSEPMERLRVYINGSLPPDKAKSSAVFGGVGTEEFPTWVLGLVAVRRLSIGDTRGIDSTSSLVTFIYKFLNQKIKSNDNSFIGRVNDKTIEGQVKEGENNLSKLEGYKIKQEIPAGDIALISYYLEDSLKIALKLCPDIDVKLVNDCLASSQVLQLNQLWKQQVVLAQWILKPLVPPRALLHVSKAQVVSAIGLCQAILWHLGHYELSGLISAINQSNEDELSITGTDSRARITKDQLDVLEKLYPYTRKPVGKQKNPKRINPAVEAVESLASMFSENDWILTARKDMSDKLTNSAGIHYSVPSNIKILLANLAIQLGNRGNN